MCHPPTGQEIEGKGLIVLVKSSDTPDVEVVEDALTRYREFIRKWHDLQDEAAEEEAIAEKAADE